jgi:hypothetical protein
MKKNIQTLNEYLFQSIERLSNESLSNDQLAVEIARSKQIADTARTLIESGKLSLAAAQAIHNDELSSLPLLLENKDRSTIPYGQQ